MTENQIKECLSDGFLRLILAKDKFKIYKSEYDHGVDLTVCTVDVSILATGEEICIDSEVRLDIQLKCTTTRYARIRGNCVEYDLRVKNYLDLKSKVGAKYIKMILVLLVLPENEKEWINVMEDKMVFMKHCYWYRPSDKIIPPEVQLKGKNDKVKILIPVENQLTEFKILFDKIVEE